MSPFLFHCSFWAIKPYLLDKNKYEIDLQHIYAAGRIISINKNMATRKRLLASQNFDSFNNKFYSLCGLCPNK